MATTGFIPSDPVKELYGVYVSTVYAMVSVPTNLWLAFECIFEGRRREAEKAGQVPPKREDVFADMLKEHAISRRFPTPQVLQDIPLAPGVRP